MEEEEEEEEEKKKSVFSGWKGSPHQIAIKQAVVVNATAASPIPQLLLKRHFLFSF